MKKNVYGKSILRTIFGSMGRYISIMAIIALGVGFFAGIKVTKSSMVQTFNTYVHEYNMYDFRLVSTLGFTDEEISRLADTEGISDAEGSITRDIYSLDGEDNRTVYRVHSITDKVNDLKLSDGRMPEKAGECVGDKDHFSSEDIGSTVLITDENDKDTREGFSCSEMKLVGLVSSPVYINRTERGTSSLGDGNIDAYLYADPDTFDGDYYTEAYLTVEDDEYIYSSEYEKNIKDVKPAVKAAGEECGEDRYDEILAEAQEKIDDAREELESGRAELESKKQETYAELDNALAKLNSEKKKLNKSEKQLKSGKSTLRQKKEELEGTVSDLELKLSYANMNLEMAEEKLREAEASGDEEAIGQCSAAVEEARAGVEAVSAGMTQAQAGLDQVNEKLAAIPASEKQLKEGRKALSKGYEDYEAGRAKAESEFAKAEEELADGEEKLAREERKLKDIEKPELYVQTRDDNTGYTSYDSNSDIVDSIAKIFPVFFFLIAALVCSTTMTRMVEEERGQIGVLRALGYSRGRIMWKYMVYSGSAAVIGCIGGFLAGSKFFPLAIFTAYGMLFDFAPLEFYFSLPLALISLGVALLCSVGTTYLACRSQLKEMPAEIMLPKAPKAGKRVLMERITPLWKRLKFTYKVSVRNVFRYKKRMFMMIAGIAGCTALVLAGFGIYDSVGGLTNHQYDEIEKYDITVAFEKEPDDETLDDFTGEFAGCLEDYALLEQVTVNAKSEKKIRSCNMIISDDDKSLTKLIDFRNDEDESKIGYPGYGECVINNKLAELMGVSAGDMLTVEYDDTKTVSLKVSGVYRNYVGNFIFITPDTYDSIMNKEYSPSVLYVEVKDGADVREAAGEIGGFDGVAGMVLNLDTREHVEQMMKSLDYVVWLVIGCAGALAFIVLFNLTNINITERVREIATIKVLGFYPRETGAYVLRENLMLVAMGIGVGLPLGILLHKFIMSRIVVDAVSFNTTLEPLSYVYTVIAVICFTLIVDIIMRKKLSRINMAEALKSVD
ncbi:MAG: ABC transporter permease [Clostridiales bacterium]|nr:ABC transporter permease [Clostridiales bacterium]MDY2920043.1 FtsX-like permease family protein [Lentihominibacter sp.]